MTGSPLTTLETQPCSAMILAAGLGTRLFPLTQFRAKPAVPFLGRPLIHSAMTALVKAGVRSVVINLHYRPDTIREAADSFEQKDALDIAFSSETEILGTSGAVRQARHLIRGQDLILINGKIYSEIDLGPVLEAHRESDALVTLVVVPFPEGATFNPVRVSSRGVVLGFGPEGSGVPHVFTGIQIWDRRVVQEVPPGASDSVKDIYPHLIQRGERVLAYVTDSDWCECSTPQRYWKHSMERVQDMGAAAHGQVDVPWGRDVVWGADVEVGTGSRVENTIVWEDVVIQKECLIRDAIICAGVRLPSGTHLDRAIVTPRFDWTGWAGTSQPQVERDYLIWPLNP